MTSTSTSALASADRLGLAERASLAVEIAAAYVRARWVLRRRGLRPALADLRSVGRRPGPGDPAEAVAVGRRLGRAVRRTLSVLPADSRCLSSSLVLTRLLAARGIDSQLVISVHPGETFGAHAWLEHEGAALLPPEPAESGRLTTL